MNNPALFNAAFSGAAGGLSSERWIASNNSSNYLQLRNDCLAFATAVDQAIATDINIGVREAGLLQSLCANILTSRGSPGSSFNSLAGAIASAFGLLRAQLQPELGTIVAVTGYNAAAPTTLTLLAADHAPGLYTVSFDCIVRAVATSGTLTKTVSYAAPTFGPITSYISASGNLNTLGKSAAPGSQYFPTLACRSTGAVPLTLTLTPNAVVGVPTIDLYASASLIAQP
jgi:hypothetical protein